MSRAVVGFGVMISTIWSEVTTGLEIYGLDCDPVGSEAP